MIEAAVDAFGGIDVLVNNAGSEVQGPIDTLPDEDFEAMLAANVRACSCAPGLRSGAPASRGPVINLGSTVVGPARRAGRFGYVASKGAVEAMSRALALDLGRDGIRVNVIRPGIIPSELRGLPAEAEERARVRDRGCLRQAGALAGRRRALTSPRRGLARRRRRPLGHGAVIDIDGGYVLGAADT